MRIVFYSKRQCPLCERGLALVEAARARYAFSLETRDIEGDPALWARYRYEIPVVEIDGEPAVKLRFSAQELEAALQGASAK